MLRLFAFIVALGLMGCSSSPPATPAQSDAQTSSTAVSGGDVGALLNAARARNGLPPLARSRQLTAAAEAHARDMARNRFFSHTGSDRSSVGQRVQRQGYGFCFVAENIAQGQKTAQSVMQSWMNSRGHRRNNLSSKASEYGIARASGDIWVLVFGRSGC